MRILDCAQGSPEWHQARLGIPTASNFKLLYTSQGKPSTSAIGYRHTLLAERLMEAPTESYENEWMRRGTELEPDAREWYEFVRGVSVRQVGFVLRGDGRVGASPDGLIGDEDSPGGLEIKCPKAATHIAYLLAGKCPSGYTAQVQGCMYITGAEWWDFMSFHPGLDPLIVRVERDTEYIKGLEAVLADFLTKLEAEFKQLRGPG